jgi:hypothetical protein
MDELRAEIERLLDEIPITAGGGCSVRKAYTMAWLIRRYELRCTLDIGVYRGRSLFPQALAHRRCGGGVAYGIDPWSATAAEQHDTPQLRELLEKFVRETDFDALYDEVVAFRKRWGLEDHCVLVRETSQAAVERFERENLRFGLIHIDGNHDTEIVVRDVELYLPRLDEGGFLVLDDVSWESVRPAYDLVADSLARVHEHVDERTGDDYAVFRKGGPAVGNLGLRPLLRYLVDR